MRISRGYADGPFGQIHYQEEGSGEQRGGRVLEGAGWPAA